MVAGWDFTWTAPEAPGDYTLFGAGNSVNRNNQDTGDRSNTTTLDVMVSEPTATSQPTATPTATPILPTATVTPTFAPLPCVGDCDHRGDVGVSELITGVNIALGNAVLTVCPEFDTNGSNMIEINELIAAVNSALLGYIP